MRYERFDFYTKVSAMINSTDTNTRSPTRFNLRQQTNFSDSNTSNFTSYGHQTWSNNIHHQTAKHSIAINYKSVPELITHKQTNQNSPSNATTDQLRSIFLTSDISVQRPISYADTIGHSNTILWLSSRNDPAAEQTSVQSRTQDLVLFLGKHFIFRNSW